MERESFVFYRSFYNSIKNLSVEDRDALSMAMYEYALNWIEPQLDWYLLSMFDLIRPQIDANNKRYSDWCKWGEFGTLWWAPKWNKNAVKSWWKIQKQPQNNPKTTPNDNDNVNDNVNDNDNEKNIDIRQPCDADIALDADASRWNKKDAVQKKNNKHNTDSDTLKQKLTDLWLEDEVIELAIVYNWCKKWKKLHKFADAQLKIRVNKLRKCWFDTIDWMKQVLENSIAGWYEWIFELKHPPKPTQQPQPKLEKTKVINSWWYNFYI